MNLETTSFHGWDKTIRLWNDAVELMVTTDVGPRIVSYKTQNGQNVFKLFEDQLGTNNEDTWCIRGGHRFWLAPEDEAMSYHLDNSAVSWTQASPASELEIESTQQRPQRLRKTLGISVPQSGPKVTIRHTVTNDSELPISVATWGLSVMEPGGLEIIPQPPLGSHPEDIAPNRGMVLWPYTDLSDLRWTFGRKFILLRQEADAPPTKIGLTHREKWVGYLLGDSLFIKTFAHEPGANYPDGGCNFETFTDEKMLEIESLGPLVNLEPGASSSHVENWFVFPLTEQVQIESEDSLAEWIAPFVRETRLG